LHALDGTPSKSQIDALSDYLAREEEALAGAKLADRAEQKFQIVFAAYLAAYAGDTKLAQRALAAINPESDADTPVLDNLRRVAKAEIERASGRPRDALATLKSLVNGSELYITHVVLMDAYADVRDNASALAEAQWLSSHRGQAYIERNMQFMLAPFDVAQSNLALLRAAQFSSASGDKTSAQRFLAAFETAWPTAAQLPWLSRSLQELREQR
jgi:hypothetical protein